MTIRYEIMFRGRMKLSHWASRFSAHGDVELSLEDLEMEDMTTTILRTNKREYSEIKDVLDLTH